MRLLLLVGLLLSSVASWGGGSEVPWPFEILRWVRLNEISGVWVSSQGPFHLYQISASYKKSLPCPFKVEVVEVYALTGEVMSTGGAHYCNEVQPELHLVLYSNTGRATKKLDIVGILKRDGTLGMGDQFLGLTSREYRDGQMVEAISEQDVFLKFSEVSLF